MNSNYNEETVRAFKSYIMQIIQHSAVDYIRKVKSSKYTEIAFTDAIDISVSLSNFDEGTFFDFDNTSNFSFSNKKNERAFYGLTKKERKIFLLLADGYTPEDISKELNIRLDNVYSSIYVKKKKFKKRWEEK